MSACLGSYEDPVTFDEKQSTSGKKGVFFFVGEVSRRAIQLFLASHACISLAATASYSQPFAIPLIPRNAFIP